MRVPGTLLIRSGVGVALMLLTVAPALAGGGFETRLASARALELDPAGIAVSGRQIEIGHLRLHLDEVTLHRILDGDDALTGLYIRGKGRYRYTTDDPIDAQLIEANVGHSADAKLWSSGAISDSFDALTLLFTGTGPRGAWPEEAAAPATDSSAAERGFRRALSRIERSYLELDHLRLESAGISGNREFVYAEIEGRGGVIGYEFDTLRQHRERLFGFRKVSGFDLRFHQRISTQLIDGGIAMHNAPVSLAHLDLDVRTADNRNVRSVTRARYTVGVDRLSVVPLLLDNHRDPDRYDWESARNAYRLTRVTDGQGRSLEFSHRYHELLVELAEPASRGDSLTLEFATEGEILTAMDGERRDNYFELFTTNWLPYPRGWHTQSYTLGARIQTRHPFRPLISATTTASRREGDNHILEAASDKPIEYLAIFAGKYKTHEETFGDLTIRVHAYAMARKNVMQNMPKLAHAFIQFYESVLGPYPFDELDIVEVPEFGFGIAPPGMVLITTEAYKPHNDVLASFLSHGINARLAHEIAHHWFGHAANPRDSRETWLSESLAEYLSGMAMAAAAGDKRRVMGFDEMFTDWWKNALYARDSGPIAGASELAGPNAFRHRFYLLYCKGPLVLRTLHSMIGNDRFYAILRRFLDEADMGFVTTADLERASEQVLGIEMDWFFRQWIDEGGIPVIDVEHRVTSGENGQPTLVGRVSSDPAHPAKRVVVPIIVEYGGGAGPQIISVDLDGPHADFEFELPAKPKRVKVDPARNTLAQYD